MSEGKEGPDSGFQKISRSLKRIYRDTKDFIEDTDLKFDKDAVVARQLLQEVGIHLGFLLDSDNLPKIIEVKSSTSEYISIRRIEGSALQDRIIRTIESSNKDPFEAAFTAFISNDTLAEGQIMILDTPSTYHLDCKNKETKAKISSAIGDRIDSYSNFLWLAMMGDHPELYRPEEWKPSSMNVILVTKKGGKLFSAELNGGNQFGSEYALYFFRKLKIGRNKTAEVITGGYFQSVLDLEASQDNLRKFGRIYLLVEGSSEKQKIKKPLAELKSAPSSFPEV